MRFLYLMILASVASFASCGKDDEKKPRAQGQQESADASVDTWDGFSHLGNNKFNLKQVP